MKAYDNLEPQFRLKKDCEKKIQKQFENNEREDSALLRVMIKSVLKKVVIEGMACSLIFLKKKDCSVHTRVQ